MARDGVFLSFSTKIFTLDNGNFWKIVHLSCKFVESIYSIHSVKLAFKRPISNIDNYETLDFITRKL